LKRIAILKFINNFRIAFVKQLNMVKFNSILKFIIHLCTIYTNPVITVYLINVGLCGLGEDARVYLILLGCQSFRENSFTKLPPVFSQRACIITQVIFVCISTLNLSVFSLACLLSSIQQSIS